MCDLVKISEFLPIGEDSRGSTSKFSIPRKQDNYIYMTRKAGTLSGNTYHEGKSAATNPKIFLLLSGTIKLSYRKVGNDDLNSIEISHPSTIEIQPFVTHKIEAITDISILECNSIEDIKNDRFRENVEVI